jgi:hypothetical protein
VHAQRAVKGLPEQVDEARVPVLEADPFMKYLFCAVLTLAALYGSLAPRRTCKELHAGTALRLDIEDLARRAALAIEGRVLATRAFRDERGLVRTEFTLSVHRTFTGEPFGTRTFALPGGVLADGSGTALSGMPAIDLGEDVLLFLSAESANGLRMPVGLAQGKFRLVRDAQGRAGLERAPADLLLLDRRTRALAPDAPAGVLAYEEVVRRVAAALRAKSEGR